MTVDQYFSREVYWIIDTLTEQLAQDPNRKFIYVETAFFARWWEQADDFKRTRAKSLVKNKQLEFINGGWCMHDEASPLWTAMVDQTTRGHQFIKAIIWQRHDRRKITMRNPFLTVKGTNMVIDMT